MKQMRRQHVVLVGLGMLIALVAAGWWVRGRQADISIPQPDLTDAHPKVIAVLEQLHTELELDPTSAKQWGELGMVLMAHGWKAEAVAAFEHAVQRDGRELRWAYLRGMLLETNDLQEAEAAYSHAATIDPNYAPLRYRWAEVLIRLDQLAAAEEQLRAAAQLALQSPHPQLALGRLAIDRRDFAAARVHFQQAAEIAPYCREAREQLARANFLLGDRHQAERDQKLASSLPPAYPGLADPILQEVNQHELVARQSAERADQLAASGKVAAAAAAFKQLIEDRPDLSRPRLNLATLLAMQGDMQNAAAMYRETIDLFPSEALAQQGLGAVLEGAGDVDGAIEAYRECVRLKPDYAQAYHALGLLWEQKGKLEQAVSSYRAAIDADARFAPAHLSQGLALQKLGELDSAVASIENAVRLAPHDAVPQGFLRRARQAQQQSSESRQDANRENQGENAERL